MTNYAHIETKIAYLSGEFGLQLALRKFAPITEAELAQIFGRYTRGKRKGLLRGYVEWTKCERGGWVKDSYGEGYVCKPGSSGYKLVNNEGKTMLYEFGHNAQSNRVVILRAIHGSEHPEVKLAQLESQLTRYNEEKEEVLKQFYLLTAGRKAKLDFVIEDAKEYLQTWARLRFKLKQQIVALKVAR